MKRETGGPPKRRRAVFLDRDGTLTEPRQYPSHPDDLVLLSSIGPPLRALQDGGVALVVITNQSGLARGLFDEGDLAAMHEHLSELLAREGVRLDGVYVCPHYPEGSVARFRTICACRKPSPGMIYQAAHDLGIELAQSWMVGDSVCDIEAGRRAGTRTALVAEVPQAGITAHVHGATTAVVLEQVWRAINR
ncbi:D-glycero-alpha-D-manno-heptose-1,7-bisphosphate 7-phosphatase [Kitasatospora sp. NPDC052896]|uniref:D-glycero-alpha-D-manno-heptose-1,7-bisphosphate 7-phosphatase n=1 Tax=Kitasatospora sp. NPDC052896 TaxID=3364061 RepID=UPI0037C8D9F1